MSLNTIKMKTVFACFGFCLVAMPLDVFATSAASVAPSSTKAVKGAEADSSSIGATADNNNTDTTDILPDEPEPAVEKDPYEGFNRAMFTFNEKLDKFILKPVARAYNAIMPRPLNEGVHNFFVNINSLPTIANDLLQANFYQATSDSWRLVINTTLGVGGFFDIADRMKLKPYSNDFGLTLAKWGYANSNYLVLPFFGPSTPRDGIIGLPVDYFAFSIYPYIQPTKTRYIVYGVGVVDKRAQLLKFQEVIDEASVDKYVFVRNAYMQRRAYQIDQNNHRSFEDQASDQPLPNPVTG